MANYFNSRPSARGDMRALLRSGVQNISIHAPPRGATFKSTVPYYDLAISIHAPPRGATSVVRSDVLDRSNFNSRPSARGDASVCRPKNRAWNFNSRPSARGDPKLPTSPPPMRFQFTPLREGRPCAICASLHDAQISIHAPPRGATHAGGHHRRLCAISIHAPPRGATLPSRS